MVAYTKPYWGGKWNAVEVSDDFMENASCKGCCFAEGSQTCREHYCPISEYQMLDMVSQ